MNSSFIDKANSFEETRKQLRMAAEKEVDLRRESFEKDNENLLSWLRGKVYGEPEDNAYNFLNKMVGIANTKAEFTEKQLAALLKIKKIDEDFIALRNSSKYVGVIGQNIELNVTVKNSITRHGSIHYSSRNSFYIITKMIDQESNSIVSMSKNFNPADGAKLRISAIVKKHNCFRDIKETVIRNIKILEVLE